MTVDEVRAALDHPEELEVDDRLDLELALARVRPLYRQLLALRAAGYTKREAFQLLGCHDGRAMQRAERALVKEMNRGA